MLDPRTVIKNPNRITLNGPHEDYDCHLPSSWVESYKSNRGCYDTLGRPIDEYIIPDYKIERLISFEEKFERLKHDLEGYKLMCARFVAVTRFYAMRENWTFSYAMNRKTNFREIVAWDMYYIASPKNKQGEAYGGKTARLALGEFQGQIAKLEEEIGAIELIEPTGIEINEEE